MAACARTCIRRNRSRARRARPRPAGTPATRCCWSATRIRSARSRKASVIPAEDTVRMGRIEHRAGTCHRRLRAREALRRRSRPHAGRPGLLGAVSRPAGRHHQPQPVHSHVQRAVRRCRPTSARWWRSPSRTRHRRTCRSTPSCITASTSTTIPFGAGDGGYVALLGRMAANKGVHRAIAVARAAGMRLKIAAKMREPHEQCLLRGVRAAAPRRRCRLSRRGRCRRQRELLASAAALLNPISWREPSAWPCSRRWRVARLSSVARKVRPRRSSSTASPGFSVTATRTDQRPAVARSHRSSGLSRGRATALLGRADGRRLRSGLRAAHQCSAIEIEIEHPVGDRRDGRIVTGHHGARTSCDD